MEPDLQLRRVAHKAQGTPDIEIQELQERGQQHYRAQEYQHALRCFTKALEFGLRAPISVLDNRAATYIKLNNLDAALNDGRRMIQQEKLICTGYFRTGQILQLYNNQKMALEIYEMGMRKVPNTSSQFNKLKEIHNKLKLQLVQVNPLEILPLEIIEMVMKLLRFEEIVRLTGVSKSWRTLLVSMPTLWNDLDFAGARNPAKLWPVRNYIKRANGNVTRASLDRYGPTIEGIARYITSTCPALQELRMNGGYLSSSLLRKTRCSTSLKKLYASSQCRISIDAISEIFCHCPNLEVVEAHVVSPVSPSALWKVSLPHLHSLILRGSADVPRGKRKIDLTNLLAVIPNVRNLTIANWDIPHNSLLPPNFAALRKLESLDISGLDMASPLELPSSIHTLNISKSQLRSGMMEWEASRLVRFSLAYSLELINKKVLDILEWNRGNLTYLDTSDCPLHPSIYSGLAKRGYLKEVEELKLNYCDVDDEVAVAIAENLPILKRLSLANTGVSGVGVKAIVTALEGKLEYLNLDGCKNTAYDAVEWARSKGVRVAFGFSERRRGGKRLREG